MTDRARCRSAAPRLAVDAVDDGRHARRRGRRCRRRPATRSSRTSTEAFPDADRTDGSRTPTAVVARRSAARLRVRPGARGRAAARSGRGRTSSVCSCRPPLRAVRRPGRCPAPRPSRPTASPTRSCGARAPPPRPRPGRRCGRSRRRRCGGAPPAATCSPCWRCRRVHGRGRRPPRRRAARRTARRSRTTAVRPPAPFLAGGVPALDPRRVVRARLRRALPPVAGRRPARRRDLPAPIPPDGAVAGTYAARALARGAWIAPARAATRRGRSPWSRRSTTARLPSLAAAGINPLAEDPSGLHGADRGDDDRRGRRAPGQRAPPDHAAAAAGAPRGCAASSSSPTTASCSASSGCGSSACCTDMYLRGAFAGAIPQEAFEVSTGDNVNPPEAVDAGRFVVEVRFAPVAAARVHHRAARAGRRAEARRDAA